MPQFLYDSVFHYFIRQNFAPVFIHPLGFRTVENDPYQTRLAAHMTQPLIFQNQAPKQSIPYVHDSVCLCFLLNEHHPMHLSETFCDNSLLFVFAYWVQLLNKPPLGKESSECQPLDKEDKKPDRIPERTRSKVRKRCTCGRSHRMYGKSASTISSILAKKN